MKGSVYEDAGHDIVNVRNRGIVEKECSTKLLNYAKNIPTRSNFQVAVYD